MENTLYLRQMRHMTTWSSRDSLTRARRGAKTSAHSTLTAVSVEVGSRGSSGGGGCVWGELF